MSKSGWLSPWWEHFTPLGMGSRGVQMSPDCPTPLSPGPWEFNPLFASTGRGAWTPLGSASQAPVIHKHQQTCAVQLIQGRVGRAAALPALSLPSQHCKPCLFPKEESLETINPSPFHHYPVLLRNLLFCLTFVRIGGDKTKVSVFLPLHLPPLE